MSPTASRDEFLHIVKRFNAGELSVSELWNLVEPLHQKGLWRQLSKQEERAMRRFVFALDLYNPFRQPRPGLVGKVKDMLEGEPRYTAADVKKYARDVEQVMTTRKGR